MKYNLSMIPTAEEMQEEAYDFIIEGCDLEYSLDEVERIIRTEGEFDSDEEEDEVVEEYLDRFERGWYMEEAYLKHYRESAGA